MKAVDYHLIAVFSHAVEHFLRAVDNVQHEKRLFLAELGYLLHDRVVVAVRHILSELVPDKEDAALGQAVAVNDVGNPGFEGLEVIHEAVALLTDHLSRGFYRAQVAGVHFFPQLFNARRVIAKHGCFKQVVPVDRGVGQAIPDGADERAGTQISIVPILLNKRV